MCDLNEINELRALNEECTVELRKMNDLYRSLVVNLSDTIQERDKAEAALAQAQGELANCLCLPRHERTEAPPDGCAYLFAAKGMTTKTVWMKSRRIPEIPWMPDSAFIAWYGPLDESERP